MLFTPLAAASGALIGQGNEVKPDELRLQTAKIIEATTVEDAIETHRAVSTLDPGWLGRVRLDGIPDLASDEGVDQISKKGVTLYQMMKAAAEWDGIASEISRSLPAAFKIGYPVFTEVYLQTSDVNTATVNAYLKLLSQVPDTFVARKVGLSQTDSISEAVRIGTSESRRIAREAEKILESYGGMRTEEGRREIQILDQELQTLGRNPGTTADITAASLFIALLCGFRL
jgi:triphosphoribosyl-dephospho-CoA synthase